MRARGEVLQGYYCGLVEQMGSATLGMPSSSRRVHRRAPVLQEDVASEADVEATAELCSSDSISDSPGGHASEGD